MAGTEDISINNGVVLNISQIIRAVMSLAAEAKLGALFINAKMAVSMQHTLKKMGHPQYKHRNICTFQGKLRLREIVTYTTRYFNIVEIVVL